MLQRLKLFMVLACMLLALYGLLWRDARLGQHVLDGLQSYVGEKQYTIQPEEVSPSNDIQFPPHDVEDLKPASDLSLDMSSGTESAVDEPPAESVSEAAPASSSNPDSGTSITTTTDEEIPTNGSGDSDEEVQLPLHEQFQQENNALGLNATSSSIYGRTLKELVDVGAHEKFNAAFLTPTKVPATFSDSPSYTYNPYPDYNSKNWQLGHQGTYTPCQGHQGPIKDWTVFSGHPKVFGSPHIGSYIPLELDSNLCFERETRLGQFGFRNANSSEHIKRSIDWDAVDWEALQQDCLKENSSRYKLLQRDSAWPASSQSSPTTEVQNMALSGRFEEVNNTGSGDPTRQRANNPDDEASSGHEGLHGTREFPITTQSRTAVLMRTHTNQHYTENDKQNLRAMVTELSLRSGGEYQVFLLVQVKNDTLPISSDRTANNQALENVPKEFWNMTVLWNDAQMREQYPLIPAGAHNVHVSQWFSIQQFALRYPSFDYFWNWEFDTRYTGHHYNFLDKIASFAKAQPRKGLWERNERYYIPTFHGPYSHLHMTVQETSGADTIWEPPSVLRVEPVGPKPPGNFKDDNYQWGRDEEADFISLAALFNPVNTSWVGRNDVWGYDGLDTPRRAAIGTQSRCSKKLLETMHAENMRGNHVSSEMAPQTVALLHGMKAVFAPIPIFLDRDWAGKSLNRYFNPGPKGVSGSTVDSPSSWGNERRFAGSTYYYRADPPKRLYNNWLGWEDSGIGGDEWEKNHGRICLPALLLHPVKNVVETPPGYFSTSDLPP